MLLSDDGLLAFGGKSTFDGEEEMPSTPHLVPWTGPPLQNVDWGRYHSLVLDSEGTVWEAGTPGAGNFDFTSNFRRVPDLPVIVHISAGYNHSTAVDVDGGLWLWSEWQVASDPGISTPKLIPGLPAISKVACGWNNLVAEAVDNSIWYVGLDSSDLIKAYPLEVKDRSIGPLRSFTLLFSHLVMVDSEGSVFFATEKDKIYRSDSIRKLSKLPPMVKVSGGSHGLLALDEQSQLWRCNQITLYKAPDITEWLKEVRSFVSGGYHFMAHLLDGTTMVVGNNQYGQFGPGCSIGYHSTPILCVFHEASPTRKKSARSVADLSFATGKRSIHPASEESMPLKKRERQRSPST